MMKERFELWFALAMASVTTICSAAEPNEGYGTQVYRQFSADIDVTDLAKGTKFTPVSVRLNFSEILARLGESGIVDERSIRLYRRFSDGRETEVPVQFNATQQPRLKERKSLPDTPPNVSYLGEYAPGETPRGLNVEGELSWVIRAKDLPADSAAPVRYRLSFGVPRNGLAVQVPFGPQNFRVFDSSGRASAVRWFPRMQIRPQWPLDGKVQISELSDLVTAYYFGPAIEQAKNERPTFRRPFLYPVTGPDGISLTEFGKPHDPTGSHAHHYSLWIAHANVDGNDFWSERRGGLIVHERLEQMEDGPVFCEIVQRTTWIADTDSLLNERRRIVVYAAAEDFRLLDVELEFATPGDRPVTFGKTSFGFLAARVAQSMTVFDGGGEIVNSAGDLNERDAHLKHAAWMDQSGPVAPGIWNGIAMLDHPDNPNHPTGWHCRNDGWAGAAFNMDGPYTLEPGNPLRLRYRVVLHRGNAATGNVEQHFREFAVRPVVRAGEAMISKQSSVIRK